jgi:hypothetical protein
MQEASISRSAPLEAMSNSQERTAMSTFTGTFLNETIIPGFVSASVTANPVGSTPVDFFPDVIDGGLGKDVLGGGDFSGDTFVYHSIFDSLPLFADQIIDFSQADSDQINLSGIDANPFIFFDQDFTTLTEAGSDIFFTLPGQLHFNNSTHVLSGNVDFTPWADFAIELPNTVANLTLGAFDDVIG